MAGTEERKIYDRVSDTPTSYLREGPDAHPRLDDPDYRFDRRYRTGLLTFWGCSVLIRRDVLERLGGYDPAIFVWANELEFMLRFYDAGFRHLHLPDVVAVHMKETGAHWTEYIRHRSYRINTRHVRASLFRRVAASPFAGCLDLLHRRGPRAALRHQLRHR